VGARVERLHVGLGEQALREERGARGDVGREPRGRRDLRAVEVRAEEELDAIEGERLAAVDGDVRPVPRRARSQRADREQREERSADQ
jgi:hypothetical protein